MYQEKLSTKTGNPIARISGNRKYKMLYLREQEDSDCEEEYKLDIFDLFSQGVEMGGDD
jgi:hypothetical protein